MHHHHDHSHHHHHESDARIGWAFFLNAGFTVIEFIGGWLTNSTAIMADAVHDLGDTISIGMAWVLNKLSRKEESQTFTYGYRRLSLFGALLNGLILLIGSIWVMIESIPRLFEPQMPMAEGMLLLAILGVSVNGYAAYKLSKGKTLNERVLNWHLLEDVLGWVAVLVVSIVLMFADLPILDPILSIAFTLFILINVFRNLKATMAIFLQAIPDKERREQIINALTELPLVNALHDVHFWSLDGEQHVLTIHIELAKECSASETRTLKTQIAETLAPFELAHTTIEFEQPGEMCRDNEK